MSKAIISITPFAAQKIHQLIQARQITPFGIRVSVKSGGCSGLKYIIEYADEQRPFEEVVDCIGIKVLIDPKAIMYLINSEMDFVQDNFKSGFVFVNPNEKAKCGCGKSFNI